MFIIKRAKYFPKKIGQQRRDKIKIQQLIHLNSNAMKTISGSTYQTKLSSLGEIIIFCYWLQRSSVYSSMSGNTWCVTMQCKSLWAGNIANSYDTREYSVTREFWSTIHRLFKRGYITAQRQPEAIKSKRLPSWWWDTIKKIFSSSYYGALILITFEVRFVFFFLDSTSQYFNISSIHVWLFFFHLHFVV